MTDKELLKFYLKKKGVRKHAFCMALGFSKNFLDNGDTITMVNLRKIITHPDYQDFNLEAFIEQKADDLLRHPDQLSEKVANHEFIYEMTLKLAQFKEAKSSISADEKEQWLDIMENLIKRYSSLSQDYTKLYQFIKKEAGF